MPRRIFVYDPYATGHHAGFLRMLLGGFREDAQWRTTLLTSEEGHRHPAFRRLAEEFATELDIVVARPMRAPGLARRLAGAIHGTAGFYAEQVANWLSLRREFAALHARRRFDYAIVPYLEAVGIYTLVLRPVFRDVPWAVIPHGVRCHFPESGIKTAVRRIDALQAVCLRRLLALPTLDRVFAIDPYLARWANHPKVVYVPDPASLPPRLDRAACRRTLGLPEDACVVLVYGAIDHRKYLDLLLPAMGGIGAGHNVMLVVAGVQEAALRGSLLQQEPATRLRREGRLVELDRYVSADEELALFAAADVVWCYNDNPGSSGVLIRAGQHARPAIVSDVGLSGRIVADEQCGLVVNGADPATVADAILRLAESPALREEMGRRAFSRFSGNVPAKFVGPIRAAIAAAGPG
jgi:glycosyltransferase involved in cell wall biosynthesis